MLLQVAISQVIRAFIHPQHMRTSSRHTAHCSLYCHILSLGPKPSSNVAFLLGRVATLPGNYKRAGRMLRLTCVHLFCLWIHSTEKGLHLQQKSIFCWLNQFCAHKAAVRLQEAVLGFQLDDFKLYHLAGKAYCSRLYFNSEDEWTKEGWKGK